MVEPFQRVTLNRSGLTPDTRNRHQALSRVVFLQLPAQLLFELVELLVEVIDVSTQSLDQAHQPCWQSVLYQHGRQAPDDFEQKGVDLVDCLDPIPHQRLARSMQG